MSAVGPKQSLPPSVRFGWKEDILLEDRKVWPEEPVKALVMAPEVLLGGFSLAAPSFLRYDGHPAKAVTLRINDLPAKRAFQVEERA
jgi:hypothetical protein